MDFPSLRAAVDALERKGWLRRVKEEVDPHLEMAEIHRRVHDAGGPALYFERVKGSPFPAVSNLFGTRERALFLLGDGIKRAAALARLQADPGGALRHPLRSMGVLWGARSGLPLPVANAPVAYGETALSSLPQIVCWPQDGGAFITLPQVYTEHPDRPGLWKSNLGMYRIQISGGAYAPDREAGMHYQIHRGIGVHHHAALHRGEKLKVSIFVGGPPAHSLAAVMPLPEGVPEVLFGGVLAGRHFRYTYKDGYLLSADADFCITGTVEPGVLKPEGPFGDHLGYYSLAHDFPMLNVEKVYHRKDAIWPFTVVGRPPQEDAQLAALIHEIADGALPAEIPGLKAVHAVEAAGVHPLLLAIAEDRYAPFLPKGERKARELHTIGHAILGYGQMSLAKYLFVTSQEDDPGLNIRDVGVFFAHVLRRVSWESDLHFVTRTTMDTLDYSGGALNEGSKLLVPVSGAPRRELSDFVPQALLDVWPDDWSKPCLVMPGVLVFGGAAYKDVDSRAFASQIERFSQRLQDAGGLSAALDQLPLWVFCDDPDFAAASLDNWLWVTFTRSDPARDVHGIDSFIEDKHWGCRGPLIIDARVKPWHAPVLEPDPEVSRRVEGLFGASGSLHNLS
ncbi:MAG TPA: UbiD family decarboxylase [Fibrobacteria bacterium]|jgi:4-hydroxy-3-polyprenylbenzoate decarboxylase|nr:UbiD family decarboxylase [Fibrobacteria bacterium]